MKTRIEVSWGTHSAAGSGEVIGFVPNVKEGSIFYGCTMAIILSEHGSLTEAPLHSCRVTKVTR